jgi:hypothetical protein
MIISDESYQSLITWLLEGDPAIRWQTLKFLRKADKNIYQPEREQTAKNGWGLKLLNLQDESGQWDGGLYSPKWTSTTYTLLSLIAIGIPTNNDKAIRGAKLILDGELGTKIDSAFYKRLELNDLCVVGMNLQIASYFRLSDARIDPMVEYLLSKTMPDNAWNCRAKRHPETIHSSFHTTINILEGLHEWLEANPKHILRAKVLKAESDALEFLLCHRLFKSDKTMNVIDHKFTKLSFPYRWHYNFIRGLEYFANRNYKKDNRLQDAIDLLYDSRRKDGFWPVQYKFAGKTFFEFEKIGAPSRWNTLKALKIFSWWNQNA